MNGNVAKKTNLRFFGTMVWSAAIVASGCTPGLRKDTSPGPMAFTPPDHSTPASAAPTETAEPETLSAIEDFLARTRQYRPAALQPAVVVPSTPLSPTQQQASVTTENAIRQDAQPSVVRQGTTEPPLTNIQVALDAPAATPTPLAIPALQSVSILLPDEIKNAPVIAPPQLATNASMPAVPANEPISFQMLIERLKQEAEREPGFEAQWRLRLALLAASRDAEALDDSDKGVSESPPLLAALAKTIIAIRNVLKDPMAGTHSALDSAEELRLLLSEQADPVISRVVLCRKVLTFGVFEEMPAEEFVTGRPIQTILYSQVRNLRPKQNEQNEFETHLATRAELLTAEGKSVWTSEEPDIVDRCSERRRDFFVAQRISWPPTLSAGDYVLKVSVQDKLSFRSHEVLLPISIQAPVALVGKSP